MHLPQPLRFQPFPHLVNVPHVRQYNNDYKYDNSLTSPEPFSILETTADWNVEINNVFLPKTPSPSEKPEKKKTKITHHRLLTSCEVIREKREAAEKKTKKENKNLRG